VKEVISSDINLLANKVESLKDDVSNRESIEIQGQKSLPVEEKFVPIHTILNLNLYQSYIIGMKYSTIVTLVNMRTQIQWEVTHWLETVKLRQINP
jgi:hypothetical protein